jgi:hypothetical protein
LEDDALSASQDSLRLAYEQTCQSHAAITDFRAKLLALLPIASGGGIFLLLGRDEQLEPDLLLAVGIFGFAVTLGLFIYEYRGIKTCVQLREYAGRLEDQLNIPEGMGQFREGGRPLEGMTAVEGASWVVYWSVLTAWLYVALSWWEVGRWVVPPAIGAGVLVLKFHARSREGVARVARSLRGS